MVGHFGKIAKRLEVSNNAIQDVGRGLIGRFPPDGHMSDARVAAFGRCCHVVSTVCLGLHFADTCNTLPRFWDYIRVDSPAESNAMFEQVQRFALLHGLWSVTESSIRTFLRQIDPVACKQASRRFDDVRDYLWTALKLDDTFKPLLRLLGLLRNSVHNNGIFFPWGGEGNDQVCYRGTRYVFTVGSAVEMPWALLCDFIDDVRDMLLSIIETPKMKTQPFFSGALEPGGAQTK